MNFCHLKGVFYLFYSQNVSKRMLIRTKFHKIANVQLSCIENQLTLQQKLKGSNIPDLYWYRILLIY